MQSSINFRNEYIKTKIEIKVLTERLNTVKYQQNMEKKLKKHSIQNVVISVGTKKDLKESIMMLQETIAVRKKTLKEMEAAMVEIAQSLNTYTEMRIFILSYGDDLTNREIAEKLGYSPAYVKKIKHKIYTQINN